MSLAWKKLINKHLRDAGVKAFDVAAVNRLADYIETAGGSDESLTEFIRAWKLDGDRGDRLTLESVEATLAQLRGSLQQLELFAVVNAFQVPKISFDPVGKKLYEDSAPRSILAPAQAKQRLYLDRLLLITQRLRRSPKFQPQILSGGPSIGGPQLTDIQSLKGAIGARKYVVGCISRSEDGRYILEDSSASVPFDMSSAEAEAGFYTENCLVVAMGAMRVDGVFQATTIEFPTTEPRDALPMAAQRLNFFGGPPLSMEDRVNLSAQEADHLDDRVVVLSNVHLDSAEVLNSLNIMFTGYNDMEQVPALFVFMGNFHSRASSSARSASGVSGADVEYTAVRDGFSALAALVDQYPRIKNGSHFVFVPGPDDTTCSTALPYSPLPAYLTAELSKVLPHVTFASNPCRIRYLTREIVLFRYDVLSRLRRRCLIPPKDLSAPSGLATDFAATQTPAKPPGGAGTGAAGAEAAAGRAGAGAGPGAGAGVGSAGTQQALGLTQASSSQATQRAMWQHLSLTLLQQSHLCPLPLLQQPVLWQYDHALQLYPLPHAVIVADGSPQESYTHGGCVVFNPGSFAERVFVSYKPCSDAVETNEIPKDGQLPEYEEYEQGEPSVLQADGLTPGHGVGGARKQHWEGAEEEGGRGWRDVDGAGDQDQAGAHHGSGEGGHPGKRGGEEGSPGVAAIAMDEDFAGQRDGVDGEEDEEGGAAGARGCMHGDSSDADSDVEAAAAIGGVDLDDGDEAGGYDAGPDDGDGDAELLDADLPLSKRQHVVNRVNDQEAWDAMLADE